MHEKIPVSRNMFSEGYWFEDSIIHQIILPRANKIEWIEDVVYYYRTNSNGAHRVLPEIQRASIRYGFRFLYLKTEENWS